MSTPTSPGDAAGPTPAAAPGPPPGPLGTVRLHLQGNVLTRTITPSVAINGQWVPVSFGENRIPVHPGPITVHAQTQWLRTYGQADLSFPVEASQEVDVWYVPPMHQFTTGSMGFEKQSSKGKGWYFALLGVIALIVVLVAVAGALG